MVYKVPAPPWCINLVQLPLLLPRSSATSPASWVMGPQCIRARWDPSLLAAAGLVLLHSHAERECSGCAASSSHAERSACMQAQLPLPGKRTHCSPLLSAAGSPGGRWRWLSRASSPSSPHSFTLPLLSCLAPTLLPCLAPCLAMHPARNLHLACHPAGGELARRAVGAAVQGQRHHPLQPQCGRQEGAWGRRPALLLARPAISASPNSPSWPPTKCCTVQHQALIACPPLHGPPAALHGSEAQECSISHPPRSSTPQVLRSSLREFLCRWVHAACSICMLALCLYAHTNKIAHTHMHMCTLTQSHARTHARTHPHAARPCTAWASPPPAPAPA